MVSLLGRLFSWSVPGKLGRLNSGRNPRRTAITAAALMVGIALVTGVSVILDSARTSLTKLAEEHGPGGDLSSPASRTGRGRRRFDPAVLTEAADAPRGARTSAGLYTDAALVNGDREGVAATNDLPALPAIFGVKADRGHARRRWPTTSWWSTPRPPRSSG